jgi:hypothetical protein
MKNHYFVSGIGDGKNFFLKPECPIRVPPFKIYRQTDTLQITDEISIRSDVPETSSKYKVKREIAITIRLLGRGPIRGMV